MKRRRQTLQVSTFPFLAVLLCTMGSLILILMVMDRRARLVALARIQNVVAQRTAEQEAAEHARKAEWERARQALRDSLESQLRELRGVKGSAEEKAKHTVREIAAVESARKDLQSRVQAQRSELSQKVRELEQQGVEASSRSKLTENARTELLRLTADLDAMEKTLADLKALRQKKEQAFSLVPYRGKHGDNRRPIYVECNSRGVVFQPGRVALDGYEVSPLAIRKEIDRRLAQFRADAAPQESKEQPAYVLMLLRPSGIRNYYQFVSALAGLKIDFGYELLEEGWELAFADDDRQAAPTPWAGAQRGGWGGGGSGSGGPGSGTVGGGAPGSVGAKPGSSWAGDDSGTGFGGAFPGQSIGGSGSGTASNRSGVTGSSNGAGLGFPGPGNGPGSGIPGGNGAKPGNSWAGAGSGTGPAGSPSGSASGGGHGSPDGIPGSTLARGGSETGTPHGAHSPGGGWPPLTGNGAAGNRGGAPGSGLPGSSRVPTTNGHLGSGPPGSTAGLPGTGSTTIATSQSAQKDPSGTPSGGTGSDGHRSAPGVGVGLGGQARSSQAAGIGGTQNSPARSGGGAENRIASGAPGGEKPLSPLLTSRVTAANPNATAGSGSSSPGRAAAGSGAGSPSTGSRAGEKPTDEEAVSDGQEPDKRRLFRDPFAPPPTVGQGTSGPRNPLARPGGPEELEKPSRPLRVASNRDWVILVECTADAVILPGTGQRFDLAQLRLRTGNDNPLLQAVRTVIARRQATVRPTEPEWKPQLRFLVHTEGLRSYYAAFPALEPLRLPMTKQNRDEKEEE